MEREIRLDHHRPDAPPGHVAGLAARILHDGRAALEGRHRRLRAPARAGPDLSRQAPGQLGSGAGHGRVGPGSGVGRRRRLDVVHQVSAGRWQRLPDGRDHASGNDAGRRRRGRRSDRRALPAAGRQDAEAAAVRPRNPDHRRRIRRQGIRHRLRQDHAGARLQRLRRRPAPQAGDAVDLDAGREDHRRRAGRLPRPGPLRRAQADRRRPRRAGPAGTSQAAQADGAARRPHRRRHRADADRPVVRGDEQAGAGRHFLPRQIDRRNGAGKSGQRRDQVRAGKLEHHLQPVAQQHPGLVHLAPAVVGPPDPGVVRRGRAISSSPRPKPRRRPRPPPPARPARCAATPTCSTRGSRRR